MVNIRASQVKFSLLIIFAVLLILYLYKNYDVVRETRIEQYWFIPIVALSYVVNNLLRAIFFRYVIRKFSVSLGAAESVLLTFATTMMNFVLPVKAGSGYKAIYLKQLHDVKYSSFVSIMLALYMMFILSNSLLATLVILTAYSVDSFTEFSLVVLSGSVAVAAFTIMRLGSVASLLPGTLGSYLGKISEGWSEISSDRGIMLAAIIVSIGFSLSSAAGFYFAFQALSLPINVTDTIVISASQIISGVVSITPGAMGVQEVVGMYFGNILTIEIVNVLLALLFVRIVKTLTSVLIGVPSIMFLKSDK